MEESGRVGGGSVGYAVGVPSVRRESSSNPNSNLDPVEKLRSNRVRPARDLSIAGALDQQLREMNKQRRAVGGCAAAWAKVVPPDLAERTVLEGVSRGVLTVRVPDAAVRFALDRYLRAGGERALIGESAAALRKVRVLIGNRV